MMRFHVVDLSRDTAPFSVVVEFEDAPLVATRFKMVKVEDPDAPEGTREVEREVGATRTTWAEAWPVGRGLPCATALYFLKVHGTCFQPGHPFLALVWALRELSVNGTRDVIAERVA